MKPEMGISDSAFGLLTGFGFAVLYTVVGIPLAHLAERRNRVWIMTISVAVWSGFHGADRPFDARSLSAADGRRVQGAPGLPDRA